MCRAVRFVSRITFSPRLYAQDIHNGGAHGETQHRGYCRKIRGI